MIITKDNFKEVTEDMLQKGFTIDAHTIEAGVDILSHVLDVLGKGKWRKGVEQELFNHEQRIKALESK